MLSVAGHSHTMGAAGGRYLRRGRCPPSPPTRRRSGAASRPPRRCAAAAAARTRAPSAPSYGPADASCGPFRARRYDYARRGARRRPRLDRPRPWRRRCRCCRCRCRRPRPLEPLELPRARRVAARVARRSGQGAVASAGGSESPREGSRRAGGGQVVTHDRADADCGALYVYGPSNVPLPNF